MNYKSSKRNPIFVKAYPEKTRDKYCQESFRFSVNKMKSNLYNITLILFISGFSGAYCQTELTFTSRYKYNYYPLDSIIIENINTGSKTVNYYPDTLFQLIITGNENLHKSAEPHLILNQNCPNPFDGKTNFNVNLPEDEKLTILIYNVLGQLLYNFENEMPAGNHSFTFSGDENKIYFLVAKTPSYSSAVKMINLAKGINNSGLNLEYNGYVIINEKNHRLPDNLKNSINEFVYNPGDSLKFIGFITNDTTTVISDTIIDKPKFSKTIIFQFEKKHRIVLILYHDITDSLPETEYDRNLADFENDLKYITGHNYQVLSINDLLMAKTGELKLYSDGIIITFDDGYNSNYTKAFPLLSYYDLPATFFIVAEWIADTNYMIWPEVWQISQYQNSEGVKPFTIGSHTSSHPYLEKSAEYFSDHQDYLNFLYTELADSKNWIVDITGQTEIFLSLPYGDGVNNTDIINTAIYTGYKGIRSSVNNSFIPEEMDLFALPCISILSDDYIEIVEEFLEYW